MAEHIKILINEYIKKNKYKKKQYQKIKQTLKKDLNQKTINQTQVELKNNNKEIIFLLNSSSAAYQLKLNKDKIIKKIQKEIPAIQKIKIKVG